jgi:hypothetical protein
MRGRGGRWIEDNQQQNQRQGQGGYEDRRGDYHGGRPAHQQWRQREPKNPQRRDAYRGHQFDLRNNLNQAREKDKSDRKQEGFKPGGEMQREGGKYQL